MFKDLVLANRSYRGYDETHKLTKEQLMELVDYARLAPCAINAQPFKYFLAWEEDVVGLIQPHTNWAGYLKEMNLPFPGTYPTAFIIVIQDLKLAKSIPLHQRDVGIVAQTITLAAVEKGLGGCMIGSFGAEPLKAILNLGEHLEPVLVIALGKPNEKIVLTEIDKGESIKYYRDDANVHYVPKRKLEDIIL